jgi:hypothetical protein
MKENKTWHVGKGWSLVFVLEEDVDLNLSAASNHVALDKIT